MNKDRIFAYDIIKEENLKDIRSTGYLLRHKKTGARVMLIENDDENKVFNIAFRTPPKTAPALPHSGAQRTVRFQGISVKRSFCGAGKGLS